MTYATQTDAVDRYGEAFVLQVADRDGDGSLADPELVQAVTDALVDATAEIDTHIGARYDLPLPSTPTVLVRICVDIAIYRLANEAGVLSEEIRQRYEDAIMLLKRIAEGKASLGLEVPAPSGRAPALLSSAPRVMSRRTLRGVL